MPVIPALGRLRILNLRPVWASERETLLSQKKKKVYKNKYKSQAWWCMPIILATWEAEVGGSQSEASPD
jgi:hypothetical protein